MQMQTAGEFTVDVDLQYCSWLDSIFMHWHRGWIDKDAANRERRINASWYHQIYSYLNPWNEVRREALSPQLVAKYDTKPKFPLVSIIFYHNEEIPVYDDDYGQQVFAEWDGEEWSGGSYNLCYAEQFCEQLDLTIDYRKWKALCDEYGEPENKPEN